MQFYDRNEAALVGEKDALEKQASEWGSKAPMLYLRGGSTMVRILPPYSEAGVFFRQISKHRTRVNNRTEICVCPAADQNLACALCAKGQELTDSRDEAKMKFAREQLRPRTMYLYNVLCYSGPANPKTNVAPEFGKVYVMEAGIMTHRQIISLDQDPQTGWADITNPQAGVNLLIKRTGANLDTKYEVNPHGAGRTDVFADLTARGLDPNALELHNLDAVYELPPQEKLDEIVSNIGNLGTFPGGAAPQPIPVAQAPVAVAPAPAVAAPATVAAPVPVPVPQPVAAPVAAPAAQPAVVPAAPAPPSPSQPITSGTVPIPVATPVEPPVVPAPPKPIQS